MSETPEVVQTNDILFTKYAKANRDKKIIFMYLLLNHFEIDKIKNLEEVYETKSFDRKLRKIYGITEEYVDIKRIEDEIKAIKNPRIVDVESFEYFSEDPIIYKYTPKYNDRGLYINDLGVVSNVMVISNGCIITSHRAKSVTEAEERGFMYFYDYVNFSNVMINNWHVTYFNKVFSIYYVTNNYDEKTKEIVKVEEPMYQIVNIDKEYTYKMVLYIIKKNSDDFAENLADNFSEESYELLRDE